MDIKSIMSTGQEMLDEAQLKKEIKDREIAYGTLANNKLAAEFGDISLLVERSNRCKRAVHTNYIGTGVYVTPNTKWEAQVHFDGSGTPVSWKISAGIQTHIFDLEDYSGVATRIMKEVIANSTLESVKLYLDSLQPKPTIVCENCGHAGYFYATRTTYESVTVDQNYDVVEGTQTEQCLDDYVCPECESANITTR